MCSDEFGLQLNCGKNDVAVSLVEDDAESGKWKTEVALNGEFPSADENFGNSHVLFAGEGGASTVGSSENEYVLSAEQIGNKERCHRDIDIILLGDPNKQHRYVGILGVTLNRTMGREMVEELQFSVPDFGLETAMRDRFEVKSLFPKIGEQDVILSGVLPKLICRYRNMLATKAGGRR
ncbi:unnamed protein product [Agarophyton chilense]